MNWLLPTVYISTHNPSIFLVDFEEEISEAIFDVLKTLVAEKFVKFIAKHLRCGPLLFKLQDYVVGVSL